MSAWSILIANSSAAANSIAWVHLNGQQSGGGGCLGDRSGLELNAANSVLSLSDSQEKITVKSGGGGISMKADKTGLNV